jgi:SAM-dependent methyltransferase
VPGTIDRLPDLQIPGHAPSQPNGADHPMRTMTRRAAGLEGPPWDSAARAEVAALFDELAPEWHTRTSSARAGVVADALERGGVGHGDAALELGSGIGAYTGMLAERFGRVVATDLSMEMVRLAADEPGHRVLADAHDLPLADDSVHAAVLVNMFLFPDELDRVVAPGGCLVWVNSSGEATPIHLMPEEVVEALPGSWTGSWARAGSGLWTVLRRT